MSTTLEPHFYLRRKPTGHRMGRVVVVVVVLLLLLVLLVLVVLQDPGTLLSKQLKYLDLTITM